MNLKDLKKINKALVDKYGEYLDGRPNWRLIENTPAYTEKRYGWFGKFDDHGNYLGEVQCVRAVPKYNYIPTGIYLLEQMYYSDSMPVELQLATISNNAYYEVRWSFMDNDCGYMEPTLEGCMFIIRAVQTINKKVKKTQEERRIEKHKKTVEMLSDGDPAFIGPMVSVPNSYSGIKDATQLKDVSSGEKKDAQESSRQA